MADSVAFGGRYYRRRKEFVADHTVRDVIATPALISLNYSQGDVLGGGQSIVITGTSLSGATNVSFGGTSATITGNTSTTVTCTLPAKSAGATTVTVTTSGGTSNGLDFEFWAPTTDSSVRLFYDSITSPYDDSPGVYAWTPRYCNPRVTGGLTGIMSALDTSSILQTGPPASGGGPNYDGNGAVEYGLRTDNSNTWNEFIGASVSGLQPGSVAIVYKPTGAADTYSTGAPYSHNSAVGDLNASAGTIGVGAVIDDSSTIGVACHVYGSAEYKVGYVAYDPRDLETAVVSRWGDEVSGNFGISVNGATSGGNYTDVGLWGSAAAYTGYPVDSGYQYSAGTVTNQLFAGIVHAIVIADSRVSDTFITKHYAWAQQRFGVA